MAYPEESLPSELAPAPVQPAVETSLLPLELAPTFAEPAAAQLPASDAQLEAARHWQWAANALTLTRLAGSVVLAREVSREQPVRRAWLSTAAAVAIMATDFVDGWCARKGHSLGGPKSVPGAYGDQLTDKVLANGLQWALARSYGRQGDRLTSTIFSAGTAINAARDASVTALRVAVDVTHAPVDTAAQKAGKLKAAAQDIALLAAMSPLARNKYFRAAATAAVVASDYLAVKSGWGYGRLYSRGLRNRPRATYSGLL